MALWAALIGFGAAGAGIHAPLIAAADGLELATVVTSNAGRADAARADHDGVRVEPTPDAVFERAGEHDLVVVASPNDSHAPLAARALDHGLPVVVDKPLAPTVAEAAELADHADRVGVPLTVFQNRRWDSDFLTARRLIGEGALGDVLRFESRFERWRPENRPDAWHEADPPERGGGLLLDLGAHLIDQALQLFGPAERVYGEALHRRGGPADDDDFVAIEHPGGVISHLWASALTAAPGPRLRILGTEGAFTSEGLDAQEQALRDGVRPDSDGRHGGGDEPTTGRLHRGEEPPERVEPEPGDWLGFYRLLTASLTTGGPLPVDPRDAVEVLEVVERARLSRPS